MNRQEVPLRFHHLERVKQAMQMGSLAVARHSLYIAKLPLFAEEKTERTLGFEQGYHDLFGHQSSPIDLSVNNWEEEERIGKTRSSLDRYLSLPDQSKVRLLSTGKDWICECAEIGEHCVILERMNLERERQIGRHVYEQKENLHIKGPYFMHEFKNTGLEVVTNMGVIRSVLESVPFLSYLFINVDVNS